MDRSGTSDGVLDVVAEILETEGYDAVQLRAVARRARVSLSTVYGNHASRDALIVAALGRWMSQHRFAGLAHFAPGPAAGESALDLYLELHRVLFEPWEGHPRMLQAFHRARIGPAGRQLTEQALAAVSPVTERLLAGLDADFRADVAAIMWNVVYALVGRFADGEIPITEIRPGIDRTIRRLFAAAPLPVGDAPPR